MKIIPHGAGLAPDVTIRDGLVYLALPMENSLHLNVYTLEGALVRTQAIEHASYPRFGSGRMAYKQSTGGGANHPAALNLSTGEVVAYTGKIDGDPGVIISGNEIMWQTLVGVGDERKYGVLACPLTGGPVRAIGWVGAPDGLESYESGRVVCRKDIRDIAPDVGGYPQRAGKVRVGQYASARGIGGLGVELAGDLDARRQQYRRLLDDTVTKDPRIATESAMYAITCWGTDVPLVLASEADLRALPLRTTATPPPPVVVPPIVILPPPQEPQPMTGITDAQFSTLERLRAKYPATVTPEQIGALLNEWAWLHRSEGCGMQAKPGGTAAVQPRTGVHIWNGVRLTVAGKHYGQDVLEGATVGRAGPVRGTVGPADPASFVTPVEPDGAVVVPPTPPPDRPPPGPDGNILAILAELEAIGSEIDQLKADVAALKAKPASTLPKLRVRGRTGSTGGFLSHSHPVELEVVPE